MERKEKNLESFEKILRHIAFGVLYLIFVYWSFQALMKYQSEPTNTSIQYELGKNGKGNNFPLVTFCNYDQSEQQLIFQEQCNLKDVKGKDYQTLVKDCLESNNDLDMKLLMVKLQNHFKGKVVKTYYPYFCYQDILRNTDS